MKRITAHFRLVGRVMASMVGRLIPHRRRADEAAVANPSIEGERRSVLALGEPCLQSLALDDKADSLIYTRRSG